MRRLTIYIIVLFVITSCTDTKQSSLMITELKVDNMTQVLGLDHPDPVFSWVYKSEKRNTAQIAWQIKVYKGQELQWNSGKIMDQHQYDVPYQGSALETNTAYRWQLTIWDNYGQKAINNSTFHVGLLNSDDWKARWITPSQAALQTPYFRKEFKVDKTVKSAYLYVTAVGYYEAYLNGKKVGTKVLDPVPSQSEYRIYYSVYDVKTLLKKTDNAIGLILGEAQAAARVTKPERFYNKARPYPGFYNQPMGLVQLMITYNDGSTELVLSDEQWTAGEGALRYNHFFGGEDYDARKENEQWCKSGFDDSHWYNVDVKKNKTILSASLFEAIECREVLPPETMIHPNDSIWLYDLGQLIGGWWRIHVEGESGVQLKIQGAETLNDQHMPKKLVIGDKISTINAHGLGGNYERDAYSLYTLKGNGKETYEPRFFYSGFRYIQVTCNDPSKIKTLKIEACATYNNLHESGTFECSDPVLTQLHRNTAKTIKAIFQGAPMSNSNSEKYGWTGDAHLFAEPTNMIFQAQNFWRKWLTDIRDAQLYFQTGNVLSTIPNFRNDTKTTSATWGTAYPLIVWYNYCYYNDVKGIQDHYQGIIDWVEHLNKRYPKGLVKGVWADHVPPGVDENGKATQRGMSKESSELIASVYYYHSLELLVKMAQILEKGDDANTYKNKALTVKKAINAKYFERDKGIYEVPAAPKGFYAEQAANLIPLQYGVVPDTYRDKVLAYVIQDMKKHHDHLTTGIMGTKAMVDVLPDAGQADYLYKIATQKTYPSWGYWIENGATTHWQHWGGAPDHCHAMFGSISNFLVSNIAGIRIPSPEEGTVGYEMIHFKPSYLKKLTHAKATVPSLYGNISCAWKRIDDGIEVIVSIPAGAKARFSLPNINTKISIEGLSDVMRENSGHDSYVLLGSGEYKIVLQ